MQSPAKRPGGQRSSVAEVRRSGPKPEGKAAISALEVTDVVRYGTGRGSRIDLSIGSAGHRVRLTGLPTKHVLSYRLIEQSAVEEGLVLPYYRFANREWRKVLDRAMEHARVEPWLEGEEIAEAIVAEIRARLERGPRGDSASDLRAGKVVKQEDRLLVSPRVLVRALRDRLVDDVLSRDTIAEAAAAHLGMEQLRPHFPDARPRAWKFPLPLAAVREPEETPETPETRETPETEEWLDERAPSRPVEEAPGAAAETPQPVADAVEADWTRSADQRASLVSPLGTERSKTGSDGPQKIDFPPDPVHGPVAGVVSPLPTQGWKLDPIYRDKSNSTGDPVHGPAGKLCGRLDSRRYELDPPDPEKKTAIFWSRPPEEES